MIQFGLKYQWRKSEDLPRTEHQRIICCGLSSPSVAYPQIRILLHLYTKSIFMDLALSKELHIYGRKTGFFSNYVQHDRWSRQSTHSQKHKINLVVSSALYLVHPQWYFSFLSCSRKHVGMQVTGSISDRDSSESALIHLLKIITNFATSPLTRKKIIWDSYHNGWCLGSWEPLVYS